MFTLVSALPALQTARVLKSNLQLHCSSWALHQTLHVSQGLDLTPTHYKMRWGLSLQQLQEIFNLLPLITHKTGDVPQEQDTTFAFTSSLFDKKVQTRHQNTLYGFVYSSILTAIQISVWLYRTPQKRSLRVVSKIYLYYKYYYIYIYISDSDICIYIHKKMWISMWINFFFRTRVSVRPIRARWRFSVCL